MSVATACGGKKGSTRHGRPRPVAPTPTPFGGGLRISPGSVTSSVSDMAMTATIGNAHQVTSVPDMAAEVSVGLPSSSSQ